MLFDLTDLRLFIRIAELKSLTRAAERMHMSLAAASSRVKELEARFGVRLLYRENKGVRLSPAGETLLAHAQHRRLRRAVRIGRVRALPLPTVH